MSINILLQVNVICREGNVAQKLQQLSRMTLLTRSVAGGNNFVNLSALVAVSIRMGLLPRKPQRAYLTGYHSEIRSHSLGQEEGSADRIF